MSLFRPIRPDRSFEQATGQIAEAIANGSLRTGESLPGERALASSMDVSRRTIREAIKVLAEAGVVEVVPGPGGGTFVRSEMVPADLTFRVATRVTELSDVLEARRLIELRVAQLAGVYAEREDFDQLESLIGLQRDQITDRERYLALESRFHLTMARMARNGVLYEIMKDLFGRVLIAADLTLHLGPQLGPTGVESRLRERVLAALDIHERTLGALKTRDPDFIAETMEEHLRFLEDAWEAQGGRLRFKALPTILMDGAARHAVPS